MLVQSWAGGEEGSCSNPTALTQRDPNAQRGPNAVSMSRPLAPSPSSQEQRNNEAEIL